MAAITSSADASLFGAPLAVEQPIVVEQLAVPLESAGESRHKGQWSGCLRVAAIPEGPGGFSSKINPGPSLFLRADFKITERSVKVAYIDCKERLGKATVRAHMPY